MVKVSPWIWPYTHDLDLLPWWKYSWYWTHHWFCLQEAFTRVFCENYQKIAKALVLNSDSSDSVDQLSNRVVHVSVQLFSNKILAEKVVREQNLLHVMVKVLHDMARPALVTFRRGGTPIAFIRYVYFKLG